jgi:4-methoxybenzoate monooxygenase (O-demethylating)
MTWPASSTILPEVDVDPFSDDILSDPWQFHAALRDAGAVAYLPKYDVYALARYEHVRAALVDWQTFESGAGVGLANFRSATSVRPGPPSPLLETDPPRHDAPRAVMAKILGPRAVRALQERWLADAEHLLDDVVAQREFDAAKELAMEFPLRVFPEAVGMGPDNLGNLLIFGDLGFNTFGPPNDLVVDGAERLIELVAWVDARCARNMLRNNGLGAAIYSAADRGDITQEQAPLMVRSLLSAGIDTTVHALGAVLYALATHPDQWARLRADPSLARLAFDEAVRWQSPVQTFFRTATKDANVGGIVIPAEKKVMMFLGAANRDPRRWHDPDTFDLNRDPSGHVGFGMGLHQCVGQHIARLEAHALLSALARRVKTIELTAQPTLHRNNTLRSWGSIPVRVTLV